MVSRFLFDSHGPANGEVQPRGGDSGSTPDFTHDVVWSLDPPRRLQRGLSGPLRQGNPPPRQAPRLPGHHPMAGWPAPGAPSCWELTSRGQRACQPTGRITAEFSRAAAGGVGCSEMLARPPPVNSHCGPLPLNSPSRIRRWRGSRKG